MASTDYWYASATEKQRKDTMFWKEELKTYLAISKEGVPIDTLNELLDNDGVGQIPYKKLGFRHLNHFIYECSSFSMIGKFWNSQFFLFAKQTEVSAEVAHIAQLVKGQERAKGSNKNPRPLRHQITQWIHISDILRYSNRNDSARDYQPPPKHFPRKRRGGRGGRGSANKYPAYPNPRFVPPRLARFNYRNDSNSDENANDEMDTWDFGGHFNVSSRRKDDEDDWAPIQSSSRQFNTSTTSVEQQRNPFLKPSASSSMYTCKPPMISSVFNPPVHPVRTNTSLTSIQRVIHNDNIGKIYFPEKKVLTSVQENNSIRQSAVKKPEQSLVPSLIPSLENTLAKLVVQPSVSPSLKTTSTKIDVKTNTTVPGQYTRPSVKVSTSVTSAPTIPSLPPTTQLAELSSLNISNSVTSVPRILGLPPTRQRAELSAVNISTSVTSAPTIPSLPPTRQLAELSPLNISNSVTSVPRILGLPPTTQLAELSPLNISNSVTSVPRILGLPPTRQRAELSTLNISTSVTNAPRIPGLPPTRQLAELSPTKISTFVTNPPIIPAAPRRFSIRFTGHIPVRTSSSFNPPTLASQAIPIQPPPIRRLFDLAVNGIKKDSRTVQFPSSATKDTNCGDRENKFEFDDNSVQDSKQLPNRKPRDIIVERILRDPKSLVTHSDNSRRNVMRNRSPSETTNDTDVSSEKSINLQETIVKVSRYPEEPGLYKFPSRPAARKVYQREDGPNETCQLRTTVKAKVPRDSVHEAPVGLVSVSNEGSKYIGRKHEDTTYTGQPGVCGETITNYDVLAESSEVSLSAPQSILKPKMEDSVDGIATRLKTLTFNIKDTQKSHVASCPKYEYHPVKSLLRCKVTEVVVVSPTNVAKSVTHDFIISHQRDEELHEIEREMECLYKEDEEHWKVPGILMTGGCYGVFIPEWKKWVRCQVRSPPIKPMKKLAVKLYDYCTVKLVSREDIRYTTEKINELPQHSYRALLDSSSDIATVEQLPRAVGKVVTFVVVNVVEEPATGNQILTLKVANKKSWEMIINEDTQEE